MNGRPETGLIDRGVLIAALTLPVWAMASHDFDKFGEIKFWIVLALGVTAGLVLVTSGLAAGSFGVRLGAGPLLLLLLVAQGALSTIMSGNPEVGMWGNSVRYDGFLIVLAGAALFLVAYRCGYTDDEMRGLAAKALVLGSIPVCVYALLQVVGLDPVTWESFRTAFGRPFSTLGNPIFLGAYCAMVSLAALGLGAGARRKGSAWLWGLLAGLSASSLVLSATRASWIAFALCLMVWLLCVRRIGCGWTRLLHLFGIMSAVAVLLVTAATMLSVHKTERVQVLGDSAQAVASVTSARNDGRLAIWSISLEIIRDFPILGLGPDQMSVYFDDYRTQAYDEAEGADSLADKPHSSVLEWTTETGIPGGLLFVGFCLLTLLVGGKRVFRRPVDQGPPDLPAVIAVWLGAAAYFIQSVVTVTAINLDAVWMVLMGLTASLAVCSSPVRAHMQSSQPSRPVL